MLFRSIVFVGSPLHGAATDEQGMIQLGEELKKNNVAVDIVAFGDGIEDGPTTILRSFVENASSGDDS